MGVGKALGTVVEYSYGIAFVSKNDRAASVLIPKTFVQAYSLP